MKIQYALSAFEAYDAKNPGVEIWLLSAQNVTYAQLTIKKHVFCLIWRLFRAKATCFTIQ